MYLCMKHVYKCAFDFKISPSSFARAVPDDEVGHQYTVQFSDIITWR